MLFEESTTSEFWIQFYNIEKELNEKLKQLTSSPQTTHIYNPTEYAADLHCNYLKKYLHGEKKLLFLGMNPGPNGMMQTGVSSYL